jgi:prepilin-type N-terminal cleavage/methylation domain-containing protein
MKLQQSSSFNRKAFTLIELISVLLIMSILTVLAVGYTGTVNSKVNDTNNEQSLNTVIYAQQKHAIKNGTWAKNSDELQIGSSAIVVQGESSIPGEISMSVDGFNLILATIGSNGACIAKRLGDPLVDAIPTNIQVPEGTPCTASLLVGVL